MLVWLLYFYGSFMKTVELKITKVGNSHEIRIPSGILRRYAFKGAAIMVEGADGLLLRPKQQVDTKMSWADTAREMAEASEDWSGWEAVTADGLAGIPWKAKRTATKRVTHGRVAHETL